MRLIINSYGKLIEAQPPTLLELLKASIRKIKAAKAAKQKENNG
jgi:hypothetical protein